MMMQTARLRPDFAKAERTARMLTARQDISGFAVDVRRLRYDKKVIFGTFEEYARITGAKIDSLLTADGCTVIKGDIFLVLTPEERETRIYKNTRLSSVNAAKHRLNWTLAHEIGHVYLSHEKDGEIEEAEAHRFAGELLMPESVVLTLAQKRDNGISAAELSRIFNVSESAAAARIALLERKREYSAYMRGEILRKYSVFIDRYCAGKICGYSPAGYGEVRFNIRGAN